MLRGGYGHTPYVGGALARLGLPGRRGHDAGAANNRDDPVTWPDPRVVDEPGRDARAIEEVLPESAPVPPDG